MYLCVHAPGNAAFIYPVHGYFPDDDLYIVMFRWRVSICLMECWLKRLSLIYYLLLGFYYDWVSLQLYRIQSRNKVQLNIHHSIME